jgi:thiamine transport system substrate-binding protein
VHSVHPDWSSAYGFFRKGNVEGTLSYLTSLAYHMEQGEGDKYKALIFEEPHPAQIEYAGVPNSCLSCGLGERFVDFLSSDFAQKTLMEKNYMLPMVKGISEGTVFAKLPAVKILTSRKMDLFVDAKANLLVQWESIIK